MKHLRGEIRKLIFQALETSQQKQDDLSQGQIFIIELIRGFHRFIFCLTLSSHLNSDYLQCMGLFNTEEVLLAETGLQNTKVDRAYLKREIGIPEDGTALFACADAFIFYCFSQVLSLDSY